MPGQPLKSAAWREVDRRAAAEGLTPLEYIADWISDGGSLTSLAKDMNVSRSFIVRYVYKLEDAKAELAKARQEGAYSLAEEALDLIDNSGETREAIAKAKNQADARFFLAGAMNRNVFGKQEIGVAVQVNLGDLHLQAMIAANTERNALPPAPEEQADYEIESGSQDVDISELTGE